MTTSTFVLSYPLLRDAYQQRNFPRLVAYVRSLVAQPTLEQWVALKDLFVEDDQAWFAAFQQWQKNHPSREADAVHILCMLAMMRRIIEASPSIGGRQRKAMDVWLERGVHVLQKWNVGNLPEKTEWYGLAQVLQFHLRTLAMDPTASFDDDIDWVWMAMNVHGLLHMGLEMGSDEPMDQQMWESTGFPDEWRSQLQGLMLMTSLEGDALQDYADDLLGDPIAGARFSLKYAEWLELEDRDEEAYEILQTMLSNLARYPDARWWVREAIAWFDENDSEIVQALWEQAHNFDLMAVFWADERATVGYTELTHLAGRGDAQAMLALSNWMEDDKGQAISEATRRAHLLMAARLGNAAATVRLARDERPEPGVPYNFLNESLEQDSEEAYVIGVNRLQDGQALYENGTFYAALPNDTAGPSQVLDLLLDGVQEDVFEAANMLAERPAMMAQLPSMMQFRIYSMASVDKPAMVDKLYGMALAEYEADTSNQEMAENLLHYSDRLLEFRDPENLRGFLPEAETQRKVPDVLYETGCAFATVGHLREAKVVWEHASDMGHAKATARLGKPSKRAR